MAKTSAKKKAGSIIPILIILGLALYYPHLYHNPYYLHLMVLLWIYAVLALAFNMQLGYMGELSMGLPAFFGVGGYATGLITTKLGLPTGVGFLVAVGITAVGSFILGFPALRLKGAYFLLMTIAFLGIISSLSNSLYTLTGGSSGLRDIPSPGIAGMVFNTTYRFYYLAFGFLAVTYIFMRWMMQSRVGRGMIAVRDNEELANSLGINPFRYKMINFVMASIIASVSGWLYAHYVHILDPTVFGFTILFDILFMVLLGGVGTLPGPVLGAFIVVFIPEILRMAEAWRMATISMFMLVFIIFLPQGLYGFLEQRWSRYYPRLSGWLGWSKTVPVEEGGAAKVEVQQDK